MEELIYVNRNKEDNCEIGKLTSNWETILSNYMSTHYIKCNTYEVHRHYFIAIDSVSNDTIDALNKANVMIYSIDRIVGFMSIKFKDEKSRDLVFNVLKGKWN